MTQVEQKILLNLSDLMDGKLSEESFRRRLQELDREEYRGAVVQLKGCVPTWAYLMAAHTLKSVVAGLEFVSYDGKAVRIF